MLKWLLITPVALGVLALAAGQAGLLRGQMPTDLGLRDGRLKAPSATDNSVSSQAALWPDQPQAAAAQIAPLGWIGQPPDGRATLDRVEAIVRALPRAQIVKREADYLQATVTTQLMKYTDDLEFWLDRGQGVVHVGSASRLGRKDLGVNRARVEAIRQQLAGRAS
ncbi:MAG: DUF1499 domain-containing protein [Rubrivivax sp.]|nr:DUF1499 domain-containing protein [Rubrivivax sp.]